MYEEYWKLKEKPFENTPDPRFLYLSSQHEEGFSRLLYVIKENKGAGMLTGLFGCGKTLLGRALLSELPKDLYKIAFVTNPRLSDVDLLRMIVFQLGKEESLSGKTNILVALEKLLKDNFRDGRKTLVIIDEAHSIEDSNIFEEIRLLLNFQMNDKFLLTLLLLGQPELREKVELSKQLEQRMAMKYHLEGLSKTDTINYINHRLKVAGGEHINWTETASIMIYERSGGIPRRINQICDTALLVGYGHKADKIDENIIKEVLDTL
ncbi:MAG: AAA family ATPase [Candidatus Firestonebacteria bacterium]